MREFVIFAHRRPGTKYWCGHQSVLCEETDNATVLTCDACGMSDEVVNEAEANGKTD